MLKIPSSYSRHTVRYAWRYLILTFVLLGCGSNSDSGSPGPVTTPPPTVAVQIAIHADQTQTNNLAWGLLHGLTRSQLGTTNPSPLIRAVQQNRGGCDPGFDPT